ncbi:MAG: M20/M25/M40 family metallo-hydrolase [Anaerolineales bacterium]|jgi:acetylornithine deacetylase/succinyl-diaminopimelate desuccinylase-like protein
MATSSLKERVIKLAIEIQQIPAPTYHEEKRAIFIRDKFEEEGLVDISMDDIWNVYARLPGQISEQQLIVTAHLDTVFPIGTDLTIVRKSDRVAGPGIGDNSVGIAGLFGLIWSLQEDRIRLPGDVWLVANSGEEGLGDLNGMKKVVDRFRIKPLAYIVLEGMVYGRIYHRGLGVRRYRIKCITHGGHSWVDYGNPSAINELSILVIKLVSQKLPITPRTTLNIGKFNGGISINSIASDAAIELDLRSESNVELEKISKNVEALVSTFSRKGVETSFEVIGDRKTGEIDTEHPLVELASEILKNQGITPELNIGSTDANVPLSQGIPAICVGATNGGNGHTLDEYIYTEPISNGISQIVEIVKGVFAIMGV